MEQFRMPVAASNSNPPTPPQDSFSRPIQEAENEDEWEYEYSTTETETFYVTLDLTTPDHPAQPRQLAERDTKKSRWRQPGLGKHKRLVRLPLEPGFKAATVITIDGNGQSAAPKGTADNGTARSTTPNGEDAELEEEEAAEGKAIRESRDRLKSPPRPETKDDPPRATEVQILDIHSTKPLVSYDGHIFACRWAENIGTEMLFMPHDKTNPLPTIRKLQGDVDLLALSSARLTSTSVLLERKFKEREPKGKYSRKVKPKIQIARGVSDARNTQASFLEQFIQLKEDVGEEDNVTVHAKKRLTNSKWREQLKALRNLERQRLNVTIKRSRKNSVEAMEARERLAEMDEEDEDLKRNEVEKVDGRKKRKLPKTNADDPPSAKKAKGIDWSRSKIPFNEYFQDMGRKRVGSLDGTSHVADTPDTGGSPEGDDFEGMVQYGTPEEVRFEDGEDGLSDEDAEGEEDDTHIYGY